MSKGSPKTFLANPTRSYQFRIQSIPYLLTSEFPVLRAFEAIQTLSCSLIRIPFA